MAPGKEEILMNDKWKNRCAWTLAFVGAVFLGVGFLRGENAVILRKAINICMECIGIG